MITDFILFILYNVVLLFLAPLRAFSDVNLDSNIGLSIIKAKEYLANVNQVLPVGTIVSIIGIFVAVNGFILIWKAVNWLIRKIPTIN